MIIPSEITSNYLLNTNQTQLSIISNYINDEFICPLTFDFPVSPHISPCGHTYDYKTLCQSLEHRKECPLDRQPLTMDELIPNRFAKELIEQRVMVIFLAIRGLTLEFELRCPISCEPLFNAVKLPCGHTFSHDGITSWYDEIRKGCPLCNTPFDISDAIPDAKTSQSAREKYPEYLKKIQLFNSNLLKKVTASQLDDRTPCIRKLAEVLTCPISNNIFKKPVIGSCGHTFDMASIFDKSSCPHDGAKLSKASVVPNRLAGEFIEFLNDKCFKADVKKNIIKAGEQGVYLFLKPDTQFDRIKKIVNTILSKEFIESNGIFLRHYRPKFFSNGHWISDEKTPIAQIKPLNDSSGDILITCWF